MKTSRVISRLALLGAMLTLGLLAGLEAIRWWAVRQGVEAVDLPVGSEIAARSETADYVDAYRVPVRRPGFTVAGFAELGIAPGRTVARSEREVVVAGSAPGLRFLASYYFEPGEVGGDLTLSTAVFYDSLVGRLYFLPVRVGHRRLVPFALARTVARLEEPAGVAKPVAAAAAVDPALVDAVEEKLDGLRGQMGFPGATLAVVLPGGGEIALASGLADLVRQVPMRPTDRLMSGSIGKSFVAAVALRLVEGGAIRLDEPLIGRMAEVEGFRAVPNAERITLRMLLGHTSGVPEWIDADVRARLRERPQDFWTTADRLEALRGAEALFEAGQGFHYTDANYVLAGVVLETVTGRSWESLLAELLEEQGLSDTEPSDRPRLDGLAPGYSFALGRYGLEDLAPEVPLGERTARQVASDHTLVFNPQVEWTGGGLVTTSPDLARWVHRLFSGSVVGEEALRSMTADPHNLGYPGYDYGLGVVVGRSETLGAVYGHSGFFPGYQSATLFFAGHGFSVAAQVNCDHEEMADAVGIVFAIGEVLAKAAGRPPAASPVDPSGEG